MGKRFPRAGKRSANSCCCMLLAPFTLPSFVKVEKGEQQFSQVRIALSERAGNIVRMHLRLKSVLHFRYDLLGQWQINSGLKKDGQPDRRMRRHQEPKPSPPAKPTDPEAGDPPKLLVSIDHKECIRGQMPYSAMFRQPALSIV